MAICGSSTVMARARRYDLNFIKLKEAFYHTAKACSIPYQQILLSCNLEKIAVLTIVYF